MKEIQLTQGQVALVDDEDFQNLVTVPWCAKWNECTQSYYAVRYRRRSDGRATTQSMHRCIMGLAPGDRRQVDHHNHDTLDNRRQNLLIVDSRKNHENLRKQSRYGAGVRKKGQRYEAHVRIAGRQHHVGMFDTADEAQSARRAYLEANSQ